MATTSKIMQEPCLHLARTFPGSCKNHACILQEPFLDLARTMLASCKNLSWILQEPSLNLARNLAKTFPKFREGSCKILGYASTFLNFFVSSIHVQECSSGQNRVVSFAMSMKNEARSYTSRTVTHHRCISVKFGFKR